MPGTREGLSPTEWKKKLDSVSAQFFYYMNVCVSVTPTLILLFLFILVTFDVQDLTANYTYEQDGYGNIAVKCVFARGTRARGCIVVFRNGPTIRNMPIMRSDEQSRTEALGVLYHLPDGEYEVIAYDLEFDGTSDMNCKPVKKTVTFPPSADPHLTSSTQSPTVSESHCS